MPPKRRVHRLELAITPASVSGQVELVIDAGHFQRVVCDGILRAQTSLDISTADFKAMLVPTPARGKGRGRDAVSIIEIFRGLTERGVEIRLLHSGVPSGPALRELKRELPRGLTIRRCPRLHAKAVVVDCQKMYLGSANLTGAGLGAKSEHRRNFEMGIWTTSAELIDAVMAQFNALWEGRRCVQCQRKNVCPVPLEEPKLA